ncbi:ATP-binding protein [Kitasatospora sp. NPDC093806]|uniref:AAA family ATPase n=1 Tax=Kitasatospora sp. NPDC093806 TaxID=3155075 RepID=UPI00342789B6
MTTLFLMTGLPAAGKTTRARQLAAEHRALRLTPDEWMTPLFGMAEPDGMRDVLEGRLLRLGLDALELGVDVVVDFGGWSRDERSAIRWLAASVGASCRLVHLPVDEETRLARIIGRRAPTPDRPLDLIEAAVRTGRVLFEEPDAAELAGVEVDEAPPAWLDFSDWREWAADRWPSFE